MSGFQTLHCRRVSGVPNLAIESENGFGTIHTFDTGVHFDIAPEKFRDVLASGPLSEFVGFTDYRSFVDSVLDASGARAHVVTHGDDMDMSDFAWLDAALLGEAKVVPSIDILFSDFNHSAETVARIIANCLPRMSEVSSIYIDSASTSLPPYLLLERIVQYFQRGQVPRELSNLLVADGERMGLSRIVAESVFTLMHLVERKDRAQNSTAWLRTQPASLLPAMAAFLH